MGTLSPQAQSRFSALSRLQQLQFQRIYQAVTPATRTALAALLAEGQLTSKPLRGQDDMLALLERLTQPDQLAPELRNDQIQASHKERRSAGHLATESFLDQLIQEVADPGKVNQGAYDTCGGATVEYLMVKKNPAEFVRVASELASPSAKTTFAGGSAIDARAIDSVAWDASKRTDVDRLMQSALMELGRSNPFGHYDDSTDKGSLVQWIPGLNPLGIPHMLKEALKERRYVTVPPRLSERAQDLTNELVSARSNPLTRALNSGAALLNKQAEDSFYSSIERSLSKGHPVPVLTTWSGDPDLMAQAASLHYLAIMGLDRAKGTITLRNPWGNGDTGQAKEGDGSPLPRRSMVPGADAGTITMSLADFESITHAVVPDA